MFIFIQGLYSLNRLYWTIKNRRQDSKFGLTYSHFHQLMYSHKDYVDSSLHEAPLERSVMSQQVKACYISICRQSAFL